MVLTKTELIESLQNEVRILLHLAAKIDRTKLDYRPTPKQRSTMELLQYLTVMGPVLVLSGKAGQFDVPAWTAASEAAKRMDFDQVMASLASQKDQYASLLGDLQDAQFRETVEMLGMKQSRGSFFVNLVLSGHAAYRTQLFNYLKACGRDELSTMNLWAGMDAPAA